MAAKIRTSIFPYFIFTLSILVLYAIPVPGQVGNNNIKDPLPRSTPEAENVQIKKIEKYINEAISCSHGLHSIMIVKNSNVIYEKWFEDNTPDKAHVMYSVSKSITSLAVGFAVAEKKITVNDKVVSFFPDDLPDTNSPYLAELKVSDLLTMTIGHESSFMEEIKKGGNNWIKTGLAYPIKHKPGTHFIYDNFNSYLLAAIVQEVTGQTVVEYLSPRLFDPLGIDSVFWEESPQGINLGGTGLYLKTEDMAKVGQFLLQKGNWNGKQLLPPEWIEESTSVKIEQRPRWVKVGTKTKDSDYLQGYCYQYWRSRNGGYRADGKLGQFIFVLPDQDAVVAITANMNKKQDHMDLIWKYVLPALD